LSQAYSLISVSGWCENTSEEHTVKFDLGRALERLCCVLLTSFPACLPISPSSD
jgi:hypothetical protein